MCHLMPTYWHATTWRIWRNLIDGHMRVTRGHDLCRPIIMRIPRLLLRCYYLILNSFEYGEYVMLNKPTVPRRVPLLVQKLPTLPEHLSSIPFLVGIVVVMCLSLIRLVIVLSVLRITASDYPFGIIKLFLLICFHFTFTVLYLYRTLIIYNIMVCNIVVCHIQHFQRAQWIR